MSERMSDERLAEIGRQLGWAREYQTFTLKSVARELEQALKAEREEVERSRAAEKQWERMYLEAQEEVERLRKANKALKKRVTTVDVEFAQRNNQRVIDAKKQTKQAEARLTRLLEQLEDIRAGLDHIIHTPQTLSLMRSPLKHTILLLESATNLHDEATKASAEAQKETPAREDRGS